MTSMFHIGPDLPNGAFWSLFLIDVCIDIYVMMSSDLYGTCRHCLYGTLSHKCRRNCNPFCNVATATSQLAYCCVVQDVALADHEDIVYSICNIFHSQIDAKLKASYDVRIDTTIMKSLLRYIHTTM